MAENLPDEALVHALQQMGMVTFDQIEAARTIQAKQAEQGLQISLCEVLIQQGLITQAVVENIAKKFKARQPDTRQLGHYKLIKKIGEGGMGQVFLAEDAHVGRLVAVKVLPKKFSENPEALARFRREAIATGKLNHVNIVGAYNVGEDDGLHYYAMEYCEGESLKTLLKQERALPWETAIGVVMQVARGLKYAHEHGVIHRDIKPENIFICNPLGTSSALPSASPTDAFPRGFVAKILDLGLSKNLEGGSESFQTLSGVTMGTPHYISPEQARGDKQIDGRTDIYSLGATLYHLVTGQTPFTGSTPAIILMKHLKEEIPNPQDLVVDLPDGAAQVIEKMMAKAPADRYVNCKELLHDLELVSDGQMPDTQAPGVGKSSVAVARKRVPSPPAPPAGEGRPAGAVAKAGGERRRTGGPLPPVGTHRDEPIAAEGRRGTRGTKPVPPMERKSGRGDRETDPNAKAPLNKRLIYAGAGVGLLVLVGVLALVLGHGGQPVTTVDTGGNSGSRTPPILPPVGPSSQPPKIDPVSLPIDREKLAQEAYEDVFKKLEADDLAGKIERLDLFVRQYRPTIAGARAKVTLDELRKVAEKVVTPVAAPADQKPGLDATYFKGTDLKPEDQILRRVDDQINFSWGESSPAPEVPKDYFSARWEGFLAVPKAGTYTFKLIRDDGARFWLSNQLLIDRFTHSTGTEVARLQLAAGCYPLKVEFCEYAIAAVCRLSWSLDGGFTDQPIPPEAFSRGSLPAGAALTVQPGTTTPKPETAVADATGTSKDAIDLLPLVDPKTIAPTSGWTMKAGEGLVSQPDGTGGFGIPYRPTDEYDLTVVFTPMTGADLSLSALKDGRILVWGIRRNDGCSTLSPVDGKDFVKSPLRAPLPNDRFRMKRQCVARLEVRRSSVRALLDETPILEWKPQDGILGDAAKTDRSLSIGYWHSTVAVQAVQVVERSGRGTFTRPDDPSTKDAMRKQDEVWTQREKGLPQTPDTSTKESATAQEVAAQAALDAARREQRARLCEKVTAELEEKLPALEKSVQATARPTEANLRAFADVEAAAIQDTSLIERYGERLAALRWMLDTAGGDELAFLHANVRKVVGGSEVSFDFSSPEQLEAWELDDPSKDGRWELLTPGPGLLLETKHHHEWKGKDRGKTPILRLPFLFRPERWTAEVDVELVSKTGDKSYQACLTVWDGGQNQVTLKAQDTDAKGWQPVLFGCTPKTDSLYAKSAAPLPTRAGESVRLQMACVGDALTCAVRFRGAVVPVSTGKESLGFLPKYLGLMVRTNGDMTAVGHFRDFKLIGVPDAEKLKTLRENRKPAEVKQIVDELRQRSCAAERIAAGRSFPIPLGEAANVACSSRLKDGRSDEERLILPRYGLVTVGRIPFQVTDPQGTTVKNAILLKGNGAVPSQMPESVKVPCGRAAGPIHLLSGVSVGGFPDGAKGSPTLTLRIYYADGQTEEWPFRNGEHFADYARSVDVPDSRAALTYRGHQLRCISVSPKRPEAVIKELEFLKGSDGCAPLILGVTIDAPRCAASRGSAASQMLATIAYEAITGAREYPNFSGKGLNGWAIWAQPTAHHSMSANFTVAEAPAGESLLDLMAFRHNRAEGCLIDIFINGTRIFSGRDTSPRRGDWNKTTLVVPVAALKEGVNTLRIDCTEPKGNENAEPWFMLNSATVRTQATTDPGDTPR